MVKKRRYIAGAGEFYESCLPSPEDFIIAADGGFDVLKRRGFFPDLVVGDFDSLSEIPEHCAIVRHPAEKNETDMLLAVREGFTRGLNVFIINGGLGGRLDHTFANIQTLVYISQNGAQGCLAGREVSIAAVTNGMLRFSPEASGIISVFCVGGRAEGVTLKGLKYPLDNAELTNSFPLGVSNEFTAVPAVVSVRGGTLIVTWTCAYDALDFCN